METEEKSTYSRGDAVPVSGLYVCVPCGYKHPFVAGDQFGECTSCLSGTADGHEDFSDGLEMWELFEETSTTH